MFRLFLTAVLVLCSSFAHAELKKEFIEYQEGETVMEGYFVYDDAIEGKRTGIVVVQDWKGFGEYGNWRADELAKLGYAALAVDIYGKGVRPKDVKEYSEQAGKYKGDRPLLRERVIAGLNELKKQSVVD